MGTDAPPAVDEARVDPVLAAQARELGVELEGGDNPDPVPTYVPVDPPTLGEPSAFGREDWWSLRDYWKLDPAGMAADVNCDAGTVGDIAMCAASLRGHKHRFRGESGEDAFHVRMAEDAAGHGWLVACMADGVSSADYSAYGARWATEYIARYLVRELGKSTALPIDLKWLDELINGRRDEIIDALTNWIPGAPGAPDVQPRAVALRDLECTLTFAIVPTSLEVTNQAVVGHIGDSPALLLRGGEWHPLESTDDEGELVETATAGFFGGGAFITETVSLYPGDALLLTSDGVGGFLGDRRHTFVAGEYLAHAWRNPVSVLSFLRDLSFDLASADDDRSAVICWVR